MRFEEHLNSLLTLRKGVEDVVSQNHYAKLISELRYEYEKKLI